MSETYQVRNNYNNRYHNFSNNECNIPFKDLTELKKKILYLENPKNKLQFFKFKDCKDWDQHRKNDELKTIRDGLMVYTNPKLCNDELDCTIPTKDHDEAVKEWGIDSYRKRLSEIPEIEKLKKRYDDPGKYQTIIDEHYKDKIAPRINLNEYTYKIIRIACLTANITDFFWEKYSNNHTGYCIEYKLTEKHFEYIHPTHYGVYTQPRMECNKDNTVRTLLFKDLKWKDEMEWRMVYENKHEWDVDFYKQKVPINKIHFGKNFDYESDIGKELFKVCKDRGISYSKYRKYTKPLNHCILII